MAVDFATMCGSEGIAFFRFSPEFPTFISSAEKDDKKILEMLIGTRIYYEKKEIEGQLERMSRMLNFLDHLAERYEGRVSL